MRIKSYFASTVEAALDLARRELGEEAVLLNSRPAPPEARHLGIHEVVFGVEKEHDRQSGREAPGTAPASLLPLRSSGPMANSSDWELLRLQIEKLEKTVAHHLFQRPVFAVRDRSAAAAGERDQTGSAQSGSPSALTHFLLERDFPFELAERLAATVEERLAGWTGGSPGSSGRVGATSPAPDGVVTLPPGRTGLFSWLPGEAASEFRQRGIVAEILLETLTAVLAGCLLEITPEPAEPEPRRVLALCGPPGTGKTTMLAKLAAFHHLERQQSVAILSTDTLRIAAADQLRTYAAIMGLPCEVVETPRSLDRALAGQASRQLILIDTPGWTPGQLGAEAAVWSSYFSQHPEIEQHLVLPAYMPVRQVEASVARFRSFGLARLLLTHADELTAGGGLIAGILAAGLPVSYLGIGQGIPEDFEPASAGRLLDLAFADGSFLTAGEPDLPPERSPWPVRAATAAGAGRESFPPVEMREMRTT